MEGTLTAAQKGNAYTMKSDSPIYIATEIPTELIQLHERLEEQTRQLEEKAKRLASITAKRPVASHSRGRKPTTLINPLAGLLSYYRLDSGSDQSNGYPLWLDDVLQGIARLDWYRPNDRSIPLSVKGLVRIFDALPVITTRHIASLLLVEERQARRYMKATELALPFLLKGAHKSLNAYLHNAANEADEWLLEECTHTGQQKEAA